MGRWLEGVRGENLSKNWVGFSNGQGLDSEGKVRRGPGNYKVEILKERRQEVFMPKGLEIKKEFGEKEAWTCGTKGQGNTRIKPNGRKFEIENGGKFK